MRERVEAIAALGSVMTIHDYLYDAGYRGYIADSSGIGRSPLERYLARGISPGYHVAILGRGTSIFVGGFYVTVWPAPLIVSAFEEQFYSGAFPELIGGCDFK